MPVFTSSELRDKPELSSHWSSFGIMEIPRGKDIRPHFHDCDEWWIITDGHAMVMTEGEEYEVQAGAMVYTPMGEEHGVLEVYRDLKGAWFEGPLQGQQRRGHLHHPKDD
ncbi:MAG: cupin domain-containing protein [candidate division WS1 bacterium]|nr:cupin domain-containing protein [candidate division WS1 bacterium]